MSITTTKNTLAETITETKILSQVQDQSKIAGYSNRKGLIVAEFSVKAEMSRLGVTALPTGTYTINNPNGDAVVLPDNAILLGIPVIDVTEDKAGAGTIAVALGSVAFDTAITSAAVISADDGAGNALVRGRRSAADESITVTVASNTVTAGSFTVFVEYLLGN